MAQKAETSNLKAWPYPVGTATMRTAEEHRARAAQLRRQGTPKALEVAEGHEVVAKLIDHRNRVLGVPTGNRSPAKSPTTTS